MRSWELESQPLAFQNSSKCKLRPSLPQGRHPRPHGLFSKGHTSAPGADEQGKRASSLGHLAVAAGTPAAAAPPRAGSQGRPGVGGGFSDSLPNSALPSGAYDTLGQPNDVAGENARNVVCLARRPGSANGLCLSSIWSTAD